MCCVISSNFDIKITVYFLAWWETLIKNTVVTMDVILTVQPLTSRNVLLDSGGIIRILKVIFDNFFGCLGGRSYKLYTNSNSIDNVKMKVMSS